MHTTQYPYPVHFIKRTDGCDIAYTDEGNGPYTLLFVHGLAMYAGSWRRNIEDLKQYYRCIAIDLPGNGLSGKGNYPYGIGYFADTVFQLINALKLTNVILVGHSMGGQVSLRVAIDHPESITKLVLCAPAGFEAFNPFQLSLYKSTIVFLDFFSSEENSLRKVIRSSFYQYPEYVDYMAEELIGLMNNAQSKQEYRRMIEACVDGMLQEPVYYALERINKPTLVMFGERDALIPNRLIHPFPTRRIAEEGTAKIPGAQLIMLPRCGHFLQIEKAAEVNMHIRDFIENS